MAPLAWIVLLLALFGHTISAGSVSSPLDVPAVGLGLSPGISPVDAPIDLNDTTLAPDPLRLQTRQDRVKPVTDFSWIKRWAALGDSFTAGIGAGNLYRMNNAEDRKCSRYDRSYASRLEAAIGKDANFQYLACSGDRTEQIYEQARKMEGDNDLVVLTGGGNDLCLSDIIKRCVLLPFQSEQKCDDAVSKAQQNLEHLLKDNVRNVLDELNSKVRKDGLVLWVLYAEFFYQYGDKCGQDQDWTLGRIGQALPLTSERRAKFNRLVQDTNQVLRDLIEGAQKDGSLNYRIRLVNWSEFPKKGVRGQFCYPGTKGHYPDPGQPDLQFFKTNTALIQDVPPYTGEEKRDVAVDLVNSVDDTLMYNSPIYKSPNPAARAEHRLDPRAPLPPHCPGDREKADESLLEKWLLDAIESAGFGLPDDVGKLFHPNELGHCTIASFVMQEIFNARSEELNIYNPLCENYDSFECSKPVGGTSHFYADADRVVEARDLYCKRRRTSPYTYYRDAPDMVTFEIITAAGAEEESFDEDKCWESFNRIIHGCDGLEPQNPLNFKYGGSWTLGPTTFRLTMGESIARAKEVATKRSGRCVYKDEQGGVRFMLQGAAFAGSDFGHYSILPEIMSCAGGAKYISNFEFRYFPHHVHGYEWQAEYTVITKHNPVNALVDCLKAPSNMAGEAIKCEQWEMTPDKETWKHDEL